MLRGKTFFSFFRSSTALGLETQLKTKVVGKAGVSEPGGRRGGARGLQHPPPTRILADKFTLFKPGGRIMPTTLFPSPQLCVEIWFYADIF